MKSKAEHIVNLYEAYKGLKDGKEFSEAAVRKLECALLDISIRFIKENCIKKEKTNGK